MYNTAFDAIVKKMRQKMPKNGIFAAGLNYVAAAAIQSFFLFRILIGAFPDYVIYALASLAIIISVGVQYIRAVIVFFGQLNSDTPDYGWSREIIAGAFALLTIVEVYFLGKDPSVNLPDAFLVTIGILMAAGALVEIMLLQNIKTHNRTEIMTDPAAMQRIHDTARNEALHREYMANMKKLQDGEIDLSDLGNILSVSESVELNRMKSENSTLSRTVEGVRSANSGLKKQVSERDERLKNADRAKAILVGEATAALKDLQASEERNEDLKKELRHVMNELRVSMRKEASFKSEIESLRKNIELGQIKEVTVEDFAMSPTPPEDVKTVIDTVKSASSLIPAPLDFDEISTGGVRTPAAPSKTGDSVDFDLPVKK